jgi:hypothetical protein
MEPPAVGIRESHSAVAPFDKVQGGFFPTADARLSPYDCGGVNFMMCSPAPRAGGETAGVGRVPNRSGLEE